MKLSFFALLFVICRLSAQAQTPAAEAHANTPRVAVQSGANLAKPSSMVGVPVFVLNSMDANVSVIDPKTWTVIKTIETGKEPHHLYLSPDEKSIIVANAASDSLTFIDPRTAQVQRTLRGIRDPYHLRFSPDMKWFATAGNRLHHVDLYEWKNNDPVLKKRIATGKTPSHLWINSKSTVLYATMQDSNELVAIDLIQQRLLWRIKTGPLPADVFGLPDDQTLFVGLTGGDGVQVFDVSGKVPRLVQKIVTGKGAHAMRSAGDQRHVYVSNRIANTVSKVDFLQRKVVATYEGGSGADCMEVMASTHQLLITSRWERHLTVVDLATGKKTKQIPVGKSPHGVWTLDHVERN